MQPGSSYTDIDPLLRCVRNGASETSKQGLQKARSATHYAVYPQRREV